MSRSDPSADVAASRAAGRPAINLFHANGVDGLTLHAAVVDQLNNRFDNSRNMTQLIGQAFQVFTTAFEQLPVNPPAGSAGPVLSDLINTLDQQVSVAEIRRPTTDLVNLNRYTTVSQKDGLIYSPLAPQALVPYSLQAIAQMQATLEALPPVTGPDGTPTQGDPTAAVNTAINAIFNGVAEFTIHSNLFTSPDDFYINPYASFTIASAGTSPAQDAPGYFLRGAKGAIIPGATLHPHAPN
jgi:hypothetical protein